MQGENSLCRWNPVSGRKTVAVITGTELVLTDAQSALDLIMTALETDTSLIAIERAAVARLVRADVLSV